MARKRPAWRWQILVAALATTPLPQTAAAIPASPALLCQTTKLLAAGAEAYGRTICEARDGAPACRLASAARRDAVFARAEARYACETNGDSGTVGYQVMRLVADVVAASRRRSSPRCAQAEIVAPARAMVRHARAEVRNKRSPNEAVHAAEIARLRAQLATELGGSNCPTAATSEQIDDILVRGFAEIVARIFPEHCPCFTSADLDAAFPAGYFDQDDRGGAACSTGSFLGFSSVAECLLKPEHGGLSPVPRAAAFTTADSCEFIAGLARTNQSICFGEQPITADLTPGEAADCAAAIKGAAVYRNECE